MYESMQAFNAFKPDQSPRPAALFNDAPKHLYAAALLFRAGAFHERTGARYKALHVGQFRIGLFYDPPESGIETYAEALFFFLKAYALL